MVIVAVVMMVELMIEPKNTFQINRKMSLMAFCKMEVRWKTDGLDHYYHRFMIFINAIIT